MKAHLSSHDRGEYIHNYLALGLVSPFNRSGHLGSDGLLAHIHVHQSPPEKIVLHSYIHTYIHIHKQKK